MAYPIPQICCYFIKDAAEVTAVVGRCRVRTNRFDSYPSYLKVSCQMKYILTLTIHLCVYVFIQYFNDQLLVMFKILWFLLLETRPSSAG